MKTIVFFLLTLVVPFLSEAKELFFVPSRPQPKAPLFVALHGCLSSPEVSERTTRMSEFGETHGFYVYYPEPSLGSDSRGCFEFYTRDSQRPGGGDAALIVNRIQDLLHQYDIDSSKIFVLGMSGGASLVSVLTSCYPDLFKGAAIHSGMAYGLASTWQESILIAQTGPNPFSKRNSVCRPGDFRGKMFLVHGSHDQVMNPRHYQQVKKDYFSDSTSSLRYVPSTKTRLGYFHRSYQIGNQHVGQSLFVMGLNHQWSGSDPLNPQGLRGPDVSKMMVDYFLTEQ